MADQRHYDGRGVSQPGRGHFRGSSSAHADDVVLYCSSCGKNSTEVKRMIAAGTVMTCNECVSIYVNIELGYRSVRNLHTTSEALARVPGLLFAGSSSLFQKDLAKLTVDAVALLREMYDTDAPSLPLTGDTIVEAFFTALARIAQNDEERQAHGAELAKLESTRKQIEREHRARVKSANRSRGGRLATVERKRKALLRGADDTQKVVDVSRKKHQPWSAR